MPGARALQPVCGVLLFCLGLFPRGAAAQGEVPLAPPPPHDVTVLPKGTSVGQIANTTGHSQTFTVHNDGTEQDAFVLSCLDTGPVTCTGLSRTTAVVAGGGSVNVQANYNVGAQGNGTIRLRALSDFGPVDTGYVNVTVGGPPLPSVTPDGGATANRLNNTGGHVETFVVRNTGVTTTTYTITCSATGTVTCTATQAATVVTAPGVGTSVQATYSVGAAGPGTLVLTATNSYGSDPGSFNVNSVSASPQPPDVDVAVVNPGATVERSLCLTVAMGEGAAAECGDLRIVHPLPTTRTMNKARTPVLLYNRAFASPFPIVAAQVTLPVTASVPDSVTGTLSIGGVVRTQGKWTGSAWVPGKPRRIALAFDAFAEASGIYNYTLEVRNWYGSASHPRTATGQLAIVNRKASPFGAGWWLAGLEQYNPTTRMWIGGDGSVRVYAPATGLPNVYVAPQVDRPDTLKWDGTNYIRLDKGGLRVKFDAAGRHVATINRQGHTTTFTHAAGGLTITLPGQTVTPSYQFTYDLTAKRLGSVTSPQISGAIQRITSFAGTNGQITSITDPDGSIVRFNHSAGTSNSIVARTDRRGTATSFASHTSNKVPQSNTNMGSGLTPIIISLSPVEIKGLPILGSVDTGLAVSRLDGPRTDIFSDTTLFWHDRFGAPKKIVDPQGAVTTLERTDARFPALVTAVVHGNGWRLEASYDARGNVSATTDRGFANNPRTTYAWHQTWDEPTAINRPMGDGITMGYDATTGNRLWQQDDRGVSTRVTFGYDAFNRVDSITRPGTPPEVITYDPTIGNVETVKSPMKFDTEYTDDAVGQVTLVRTRVDTLVNLPPSSGSAIYATVRSFFDRVGRDTLTISAGPSMGITVPPETVYVRKRYNPNGQVDSSEQWSGPDPEAIGRIRTSWRYDPAGRRVAEFASDGRKDSTVYDLAGNPTRVITRRGHVINMTYDAMNRLLTRSLPAVTYPTRPSNLTTQPAQADYPAYQIPAETHTFTYDSLGGIRTANNPYARVTRTYFPNGWLETETLAIRTLSGTNFTAHEYLTRYNYDRDGRRVSIEVPEQLAAPGTTGLMSFGYSTVFDAMISADDDLRAHYSFGYNNRGELASITYPSQYVQRFTYDADGRIAIDSILNTGTTTFPRLQTTRVRSIRYNYDARGRMLRSADPNGFQDTLALAYSGMGHLISTKQTQRGQLLFGGNFSPARFVLTELFRFDGLGNRHIGQTLDTLKNSDGSLKSDGITNSSADYQAGTGRITRDNRGSITTFDYDEAGNIEFSSNPGSGTTHPGQERAMFYAADGTVRAVDWRFIQQPASIIAPKKFAFETYRYDALGRRVWMRSIKTCEDRGMDDWWEAVECQTSLIRRTVWDGEQELVEIQMPGGTAANEVALHENDTARVQLPNLDTAKGSRDRNQFYGRVIYTPGRGVDQPLAVTRINYGFQHNDFGDAITYRVKAPFTTVPFWDVKGDAPVGVFTNGARALCEPPGTPGICVGVVWPYFWSAYDRHRITVWDNWQGSLLERKRDKTGLEYKRNRYYDPKTGRFTQEDPIGLAGGLNLYGYAEGDPVNLSDPFGLCGRERGNCLQGEDAYKPDPRAKFQAVSGPTGTGGFGIGLPAAFAPLGGLVQAAKPELSGEVYTGPVTAGYDGENVTLGASPAVGAIGIGIAGTFGDSPTSTFGGSVGGMFGQGVMFGVSLNKTGSGGILGFNSVTVRGAVGYQIPGGLGNLFGRIARFFEGSVTQRYGE